MRTCDGAKPLVPIGKRSRYSAQAEMCVLGLHSWNATSSILAMLRLWEGCVAINGKYDKHTRSYAFGSKCYTRFFWDDKLFKFFLLSFFFKSSSFVGSFVLLAKSNPERTIPRSGLVLCACCRNPGSRLFSKQNAVVRCLQGICCLFQCLSDS